MRHCLLGHDMILVSVPKTDVEVVAADEADVVTRGDESRQTVNDNHNSRSGGHSHVGQSFDAPEPLDGEKQPTISKERVRARVLI